MPTTMTGRIYLLHSVLRKFAPFNTDHSFSSISMSSLLIHRHRPQSRPSLIPWHPGTLAPWHPGILHPGPLAVKIPKAMPLPCLGQASLRPRCCPPSSPYVPYVLRTGLRSHDGPTALSTMLWRRFRGRSSKPGLNTLSSDLMYCTIISEDQQHQEPPPE